VSHRAKRLRKVRERKRRYWKQVRRLTPEERERRSSAIFGEILLKFYMPSIREHLDYTSALSRLLTPHHGSLTT